jgi:hypothetical protein
MAQFFIVVFIVFCSTAQAQFSARNLMENQYGKLPDTDQSNFSSSYNKLIVNYRFDDLKGYRWSTSLSNIFYRPELDRPLLVGCQLQKKIIRNKLG